MADDELVLVGQRGEALPRSSRVLEASATLRRGAVALPSNATPGRVSEV